MIVLEEAHNFIRRQSDNTATSNTADVCRETFEKIAREGRKFGLGLVLSSQRPSELSPTVLAQCNTFLLHRIVNDIDQQLVRRLVPDSLGEVLKELPSLPSQQAILLGWASSIPILVKMRDLPKKYRPSSDDPDFWEVWSREKERSVDWDAISNEWTEIKPEEEVESLAAAEETAAAVEGEVGIVAAEKVEANPDTTNGNS